MHYSVKSKGMGWSGNGFGEYQTFTEAVVAFDGFCEKYGKHCGGADAWDYISEGGESYETTRYGPWIPRDRARLMAYPERMIPEMEELAERLGL